MTPADGENGIGLSNQEAYVLAGLLVHRHLLDPDWLLWEDIPNLGERAFEDVVEAVVAIANQVRDRAAAFERIHDIDGAHLLEAAS